MGSGLATVGLPVRPWGARCLASGLRVRLCIPSCFGTWRIIAIARFVVILKVIVIAIAIAAIVIVIVQVLVIDIVLLLFS